MDRALLIAATLCFLLGCARTVFSIRAGSGGRHGSSWFNLGVLAAGFILQTCFLSVRGKALGRCPLTNFFEVIIFLAWAMVLFYLVIGNTYRLSPLGLFTAPLAFVLQAGALLAPIDPPRAVAAPFAPPATVNRWLEFHAAFSMLAYGAFALAGIAGVMYLLQERQLKTHRLRPLFFQLPPIADLGTVNARLLLVGFILLSAGLVARAWASARPATPCSHMGWSLVTWLLYAFLVQASWGLLWKLAPRQVAKGSVVAFSVALLTLWGLTFVGNGNPAALSRAGVVLARPRPVLRFADMNIVCFGLSHHTAEVEVRERYAFGDRELPAAARRLNRWPASPRR